MERIGVKKENIRRPVRVEIRSALEVLKILRYKHTLRIKPGMEKVYIEEERTKDEQMHIGSNGWRCAKEEPKEKNASSKTERY